MDTKPPIGTTVEDTRRGVVGRVMGHAGPYVQLRPLKGGREWDARTSDLEFTPAPVAASSTHSDLSAVCHKGV
ncbi:hypothetical protein ACFXKC_24340 [Streptomyces sp. NPDC059340]|uniref:hypothetical protein n=1 Tax=Streptomyces TaxID=1883 RepID=UPI0034017D1B